MNKLKHHFLGGLVFLGTITFGYIGYSAYTSLSIQNDGAIITKDIWNNVITTINDIGNRTDGIYSSGGNVGIGNSNPSAKLQINGDLRLTNSTGTVTISVDEWNQILKKIDKKCTLWSTWDGTSGVTFYSHPSKVSTYTGCEVVYQTDSNHLLYAQRWGIDIARQVNSGLWSADYIRTKIFYNPGCTLDFSTPCTTSYLGGRYYTSANNVHIHFSAWTNPRYSGGNIQRCACDL